MTYFDIINNVYNGVFFLCIAFQLANLCEICKFAPVLA